jgi:hypothetical protein
MAVTVIPSGQFKEKMEGAMVHPEKEIEPDEEEGGGAKKKGPSRMLSKKERRARTALKKL